MVKPCEENVRRPGVISYGLSSYGYDVRIGDTYKIFTNVYGKVVVDPKKIDKSAFVDFEGDVCIIPPNSFVLGETIEEFDIPRDVLCVCLGKSTYARCGLIVNVTPLEPEWRGKITIEISNTTPLPATVYSNEGIAQILFLRAAEVCECSYQDKRGKYQDQKGLTLPTVILSDNMTTKRKVCEKCEAAYAHPGLKYCLPCKRKVFSEMLRNGYLQEVPDHSVASKEKPNLKDIFFQVREDGVLPDEA